MNFYNILNSVDHILEETNNRYKNSFIDHFIDELKFCLKQSSTLEELENLPEDTLFTLDRYEGDYAVCENRKTGEMVDIPRLKVNPYAKEGDILRYENNSYQIDFEATKAARQAVKDLLDH